MDMDVMYQKFTCSHDFITKNAQDTVLYRNSRVPLLLCIIFQQ
jgi:hypothetical protein